MRFLVAITVWITLICGTDYSRAVVNCMDEETTNVSTTATPAKAFRCVAETWCTLKWPEKGEKTAPKPRMRSLKYIIYKTKRHHRHIALKISWYNIAAHFKEYIQSYSMMIFTMDMTFGFNICMKLNKTAIAETFTTNTTRVSFSYIYKCETSCIKILPGKTYDIDIMANPLYAPDDETLVERRSIVIPGCSNQAIHRTIECKRDRRGKRSKSNLNFNPTLREQTLPTPTTSIVALSARLPNNKTEGLPDADIHPRRVKTKETKKNENALMIIGTLVGATLIILVSIIVFVKKCQKGLKTRHRKVLFLDEDIEVADSMHSVALQWLISEIKKQGEVEVIYNKWELLKVAQEPVKWFTASMSTCDVAVMLCSPPVLKHSTRASKNGARKKVCEKSTSWMQKKFIHAACENLYDKIFIVLYFNKDQEVSIPREMNIREIKVFQLMENITQFYRVIAGKGSGELPINKNHKLHSLMKKIREKA